MIPGVILPEVAAKYGRPLKTIEHWRTAYPWPRPTGKRGRWEQYDPAEVDAAVSRILALGDPDASMDELLDMKAAADEAGLSYATVRKYVSKGTWPVPDDTEHGVRRWKRGTIRAHMATRKPDKRRRQQK